MVIESSDPLEGVDPEVVTVEEVDESEVCAALASSKPLVEQRGVQVCENLAKEDVDAVRPFLDEIGSLLTENNAAIALRAISVLETVVRDEPTAIEPVLPALVSVLDSELGGVQLNGAAVLGTFAVDRPDLCSPYAHQLIEAIQATELEPETDLSEIGDRVTQRSIQEQERKERQRRISARQTLINIVVAIAEEEPQTIVEEVDELVVLLDDDPNVAGGAVDALRAVAEVEPDAVTPVTDQLINCLDHDAETVRAHTIRALGYLGDDAAVPNLRSVAETDSNDDIRAIAAETADFLDTS
jgi:hypothetical protein